MSRWMISMTGIVIYAMFVFLSTGLAQDSLYEVIGPADPQEDSITARVDILEPPSLASGSEEHVVKFSMENPKYAILEYKTKNLEGLRAVYAGLLTVLNNKQLTVTVHCKSDSCVKRRLVDPRTHEPIPGQPVYIFCQKGQAVSFRFGPAKTN